jgi:hypothetical protein
MCLEGARRFSITYADQAKIDFGPAITSFKLQDAPVNIHVELAQVTLFCGSREFQQCL